ncbi:MAG: hypothetical protein ACR2PR_02415 [Pseudohongiellaceae bacterium]
MRNSGGSLSEAEEKELFDGFEERMNQATRSFDQQYAKAFRDVLEMQIREEQVKSNLPLGWITWFTFQNAIDWTEVAALSASDMAAGNDALVDGIVAMIRVLVEGAKRIRPCVGPGPWVVGACLVITELIVWVANNWPVIMERIDEIKVWLYKLLDDHFGFDEETKLRAIIDTHYALKRSLIEEAFEKKTQAMNEMAQEFALLASSKP